MSSALRKGLLKPRTTIGGYAARSKTAFRGASVAARSAAATRARALPKKRYGSAAMRNQRTGGFLGIELKFVDYSLVGAILAPTDAAGAELDPATALCLNVVAQGDGENQRDGRQAVVKSCYVNGNVYIGNQSDQADVKGAPLIFIAMVLDTQTNGAQLNSEDVFTNPAASGTAAPCPLRDLQYSQRFTVLDSCQLVMPMRTTGTDGASTMSVAGATIPFKLSWNGELKNTYSGTTAAIASLQDNSIHIIGYASNVDGTPQIVYNSRCRFVG